MVFQAMRIMALLMALIVVSVDGKYHYPRTHRELMPFLGINEINEAAPMSKGSRRWVHKVEHERLYMEYDVTLQEGLHSLDEDTNIVHVTCHDDLTTLDLHVSDLTEVLQRLESTRLLMGDGSWGCKGGLKKDSDAQEPLYRRIEKVESVHEEEWMVRLKTSIIPVQQLMEKSSIKIDVKPVESPHHQFEEEQKRKRKLPETFDDDKYVYRSGDNWKNSNDDQYVMPETIASWGFNYDFTEKEARMRVFSAW